MQLELLPCRYWFRYRHGISIATSLVQGVVMCRLDVGLLGSAERDLACPEAEATNAAMTPSTDSGTMRFDAKSRTVRDWRYLSQPLSLSLLKQVIKSAFFWHLKCISHQLYIRILLCSRRA